MSVFQNVILLFKKHKLVTAITLFIITFNLLILGIYMMLVYNINLFVEDIKKNVEISIFLKDRLTKSQVDLLISQIKNKPGIDSCAYISKEDALKEYSQLPEFKEYIESIKINPLPDAIKVGLSKSYKNDIGKLKTLADSLKTLEGVAEVYYQEAETQKLFDIASGISNIIIGLSLILILWSLLMILGVIKLGIFVKKNEIKQMKADGMTEAGIKNVFMLESVLQGFAGSLLAVIMLLAIEKIAFEKVNILWLGGWQLMNGFHAVFMIALGIVLALTGSILFKVKNYLN